MKQKPKADRLCSECDMNELDKFHFLKIIYKLLKSDKNGLLNKVARMIKTFRNFNLPNKAVFDY